MNKYQKLAEQEKKYNEQGYTISSYTNEYGFDYEILVDADDVYTYMLNYYPYPARFSKNIYEKCKKNGKYLGKVVSILDEYNKDIWKEIKKYIFEEKRGGLYVN